MTSPVTTGFSYQASEPLSYVAFSPYEESGSLLALCGDARVSIAVRHEQSLSHLFDYYHGTGTIDVAAWSPRSCLADGAASIALAVASCDGSIRYYASTLHTSQQENERVVLDGGAANAPTNALAFSPNDAGAHLAAGGDDCLVRVYSLETHTPVLTYSTSTPIAALSWSPASPAELCVVEEGGSIRLLDLRTGSAGLAASAAGDGGLRDGDQSWCNDMLLGGAAPDHLLLWDARVPSAPLAREVAHAACSLRHLRFAKTDASALATGSATHEVRLWSVARMDAPRTHAHSGLRVTNVSWSGCAPVCASAAGDTLFCWLAYG